jgi:hypothetical protein
MHPSTEYNACDIAEEAYTELDQGLFSDLPHDCLLHVLGFVTARGLCRAAQVSVGWHAAAVQPQLWRRIALVDMWGCDWRAAAAAISRHKVQELDLTKVVGDDAHVWGRSQRQAHVQAHGHGHGHGHEQAHGSIGQIPTLPSVWTGLSGLPTLTEFSTVRTLRHLQLPMVSSAMFKELAKEGQHLLTLTTPVLCPLPSDSAGIDFSVLGNLVAAETIQIRGEQPIGFTVPAFAFGGGINNLGMLTQLTVLELSGMQLAPALDFAFLGNLHRLLVLCVGDCILWDASVYESLGLLEELKYLRIEVGTGHHSDQLPAAVQKMKQLIRLDLAFSHVPASLAAVVPQLPELRVLCLQPFTHLERESAAMHEDTFNVFVSAPHLATIYWATLNAGTDKIAFPEGNLTCSSLRLRLHRLLDSSAAVHILPNGDDRCSASSFMKMALREVSSK